MNFFRFLLGILLAVALGLAGCSQKQAEYEPVSKFMDIHGIAVHPTDSKILYVATHHGLIRGVEDKDWAYVGSYRADFMGFTMHPTDSRIMYGSGHYPPKEPNIGVKKSTDGGMTWETAALKGQVDFHAMAISRANPQILYGFYSGKLYRSQNGAKSWEIVPANGLGRIASLAPDSRDADTLWAGTASGLYRSTDAGVSFEVVAFASSPISAVAIAPDNPNMLYVYILGEGLRKTTDTGQTWESADQGITLSGQDAIGYLAIDPQNPQTLYAATYLAGIFKSTDGGQTWKEIKASE